MTTNIKDFEDRGYFIGYLDGKKCPNLQSYIKEIGLAFNFPDYYGKNLDALDECINDLDWIEQKNYALVVRNADQFLIDEAVDIKERTWQKLERVRKEWASVPNYEGEDQYRHKADFVIIKQ